MDYTHRYASPLGGMILASDGKALTGLWFEGQKHFGSTVNSVLVQIFHWSVMRNLMENTTKIFWRKSGTIRHLSKTYLFAIFLLNQIHYTFEPDEFSALLHVMFVLLVKLMRINITNQLKKQADC